MKRKFLLIFCSILPIYVFAKELSGRQECDCKIEFDKTQSKIISGEQTIQVFLQRKITGKFVTKLPAGEIVCDGCKKLLYLPEEACVVNPYDFTYSYKIPDNIRCIGSHAFKDLHLLKFVDIPNSVTSIESGAFKNSAVRRVDIPNSVKFIGEGIFENCTGLITVVLPDSLQIIPSRTFYDCYSLVNVSNSSEHNVLNNIVSIGEDAFWGCESLKELEFPDTLVSIGEAAFWRCESLKELEFPDTLVSIGEDAFWGCESLKYIYMNTSKLRKKFYIGNGAFWGCESLIGIGPVKTRTFGGPNPTWNDIYQQPEAIEFPNGTEEIPSSAFEDCESVSNIIIPNTVHTIGAGAFEDCTSLKEIHIPSSVRTIGKSIFKNCDELKTVIFDSTVFLNIHILNHFSEDLELETIMVPKRLKGDIVDFMKKNQKYSELLLKVKFFDAASWDMR